MEYVEILVSVIKDFLKMIVTLKWSVNTIVIIMGNVPVYKNVNAIQVTQEYTVSIISIVLITVLTNIKVNV